MAKPSRAKRAAPAHPIPQTPEAVNDYIREIGADQRELARIQADMQDHLAAIREDYEARAQAVAARIAARIEGAQIWCEGHRAQLTQEGKTKTARFPAGEVAWRMTPPSVRVTGAEAVITALYAGWAETFLRVKTEINKDAILATPPDHPVRKLDGLSINQREEFLVLPFETELAEGA